MEYLNINQINNAVEIQKKLQNKNKQEKFELQNPNELTEVESNLDLAIETNADTILANINKAFINLSSTQSDATADEALQNSIKDMGLRTTFCDGIYCEQHNPNKPAGDYSEQRHYYWDEQKQVMVEIPGVYYVSSNGKEVKNFVENYNAQNTAKTATTQDTYENLQKTFSDAELSYFFEAVVSEDGLQTGTSKLKDGILVEGKEIKSIEELAQAIKDGKEVSLEGAINWYSCDEDGNNKIVQTSDVVYKNGIATITTRNLNGKKTNTEIRDAKNDLTLEMTYYDENGQSIQHDVYEYDANNPNIYTVTSTTADNYVAKIKYENLSVEYKDEASSYNLILHVEEYDADGNLIYEENYTETEAIDNILQQYEEDIEKIANEMKNLTVPTPPSTKDYVSPETGEVDADAYEKAYAKYQDEVKTYEDKIHNLNQSMASLEEQCDALTAKKNEIELENNTAKISEKIEQLKESSLQNESVIQVLDDELSRLKENITNDNENILQLKAQISELQNELTNLESPIPPVSDDYILEDGSVDEESYNAAFKQYEKDVYQYEKKWNELLQQIRTLEENIKANEINVQISQDSINNLETNIDNLLNVNLYETDIENLITDLNNNGKTDEANSLKNEYQELKDRYIEMIQNKITKETQINVLERQLFEEDIPTPPSISDYTDSEGNTDSEGYSQAYENYEYQKSLYEEKMNTYNNQRDELANAIAIMDEELDSILSQISNLC